MVIKSLFSLFSFLLFIVLAGEGLSTPRAYMPLLLEHSPIGHPRVHVEAFLYDGVLPNEPDEAVALWNDGPGPIRITAWQLGDGRRRITLPAITLRPHQETWCTREAVAFTHVFGLIPACEYAADTDPDVPNAEGSPLRFANGGGVLYLFNASGQEQDTVVYKKPIQAEHWKGPPLRPLAGFGESGQILYRKWEERSNTLWPDTDTRQDWAQDPLDARQGRRLRYPGWDWPRFRRPAIWVGPTHMSVAITPDSGDGPLRAWLGTARRQLLLAVYTFRSPDVASTLAALARRGVHVRLLVEGHPVGGLSREERFLLGELHQAGVDVNLLVNDRHTLLKRYRYMHAKYAVVDDTWLIVSTENISPDAFPSERWGTITAGRRGVYLRTDAPALVHRATALFLHDTDGRYSDVFSYTPDDPEYGVPDTPPGPLAPTLGYRHTFTQPISTAGVFTSTLLTAPENALNTTDGLLGLLDKAGTGDTILVMGLYEHLLWSTAATGEGDATNPRWTALFAAAARGARVRVLLDSFFVNVNASQNNLATAEAVNARAADAGWDLEVRLGNPAGLGLHAKVWLLALGEERWTLVGSLNGTDVSHKANREMALLVASPALHGVLSQLFWHDWNGAIRP